MLPTLHPLDCDGTKWGGWDYPQPQRCDKIVTIFHGSLWDRCIPLIKNLQYLVTYVHNTWYADDDAGGGFFTCIRKFWYHLTSQGTDRGYFLDPTNYILVTGTQNSVGQGNNFPALTSRLSMETATCASVWGVHRGITPVFRRSYTPGYHEPRDWTQWKPNVPRLRVNYFNSHSNTSNSSYNEHLG